MGSRKNVPAYIPPPGRGGSPRNSGGSALSRTWLGGRLPWLSSGWGSELPVQGAQIRSLVWEVDPTCSNKDRRSRMLQLCVCAQSLQSCPTLCDPMTCTPPDFSVCGILLARILAWVAMPSFRGFSQPRDQTHISCVSCIAGFFTA